MKDFNADGHYSPEQLVSPIAPDSHGFDRLSDAAYLEELRDVERVRYEVCERIWPAWWFEKQGIDPELSPLLIKYIRVNKVAPERCADVVRMDHPFALYDDVLHQFAIDQKIPLRVETSHVGVPFVELIECQAVAHLLISKALTKSFEVKKALKQPRPWEISDYGLNLEKYPCPAHDERPAGHGAFSGAAYRAFEMNFNPSPEQLKQAETATKQFCSFRTFSAMHLASSNMLGWFIGSTIK